MLPGKISCLSLPRCSLGEGPHWDHNSGTLIYVDINNAAVNRWNPTTDKLNSCQLKGKSRSY